MSSHHGYQESFSRSRAAEVDPVTMSEMDEPDLAWAASDDALPTTAAEPAHDAVAAWTADDAQDWARDEAAAPEHSHAHASTEPHAPAEVHAKKPHPDAVLDPASVSELPQPVDTEPSVDHGVEAEQVPVAVEAMPVAAPASAEETTEAEKTVAAEETPLGQASHTEEATTSADASQPAAKAATADKESDAAPDTREEVAEADTTAPEEEEEEEDAAPDAPAGEPTGEPQTLASAKATTKESTVAGSELDDVKDSAGDTPDPFAHDAGEDWLKEAGINPVDGGEETKADLEDEWAKALGGNGADGDDGWAGLDDELGEDDFLDDEPAPVQQAPASVSRKSSYVPSTSAGAFASATPVPSATMAGVIPAAYTPQPVAPSQQQQPPASKDAAKPMKFFEELPMTQPQKARRPKPAPPVAATPPPPPVSAGLPLRGPPTGAAAGPPPAAPPASRAASGPPPQPSRSMSAQYGSFVPGPRLDPFPPEPSVQPISGVPLATAMAAPPSVPTPSRYSPSVPPPQQQAQAPSRYAAAGSAVPARYSPSSNAVQPAPPAQPVQQPAPPPPQQPPVASAPLAPPPKANARYSPAPLSAPATQTSQKTSPAPYTPTGPPAAHKFAPRTSSPLAFAHSAPPATSEADKPADKELPRQDLETSYPTSDSQSRRASGSNSPGAQTLQSPIKSANAPPRRTSTQSPEVLKAKYAPTGQPRSMSVASALPTANAFASAPSNTSTRATGHEAEPLDESYLRPQDASANDPLQRWKGAPIFHFGGNGMIVSMLPKAVPRYGAGQTAPMMKPTAGEVKIRKAADVALGDPFFDSFPGPLKASKSKKKEVVTWMTSRIEALQRESEAASLATMDPRIEERLLLWQVVKLLVEHDGVLSGNPAVDLAVKQLVAPEAGVPGGFSSVPVVPDPIEAVAVQELTMNLLRGDREKAVWHAVDHKMWAHAMLIASTVNPALWKQVVQEFVKVDVRKLRPNNQSMGALYNVFAGNFEEGIEELVPVSARAGFQMMSAQANGHGDANANSLEGLNQWRETLGLILSNRSNEDEKGIFSLGKVLASYGRVEAAHVCFLFARSVATFSGADDPNVNFSLVGCDGKSADLEAILLSEVYEFATAISSKAPQVKEVPHLHAYKLRHAFALAESGSRDKASQYCDVLAAAMSSATKRSAYFNPALGSELQGLARRLSQMPNESSSSWTARPSMEKITGKMWSSFNKFVAGDDNDAASNASSGPGEGDMGPFSRVAGGTPTISRPPSRDMYGAGVGPVPVPQWGGPAASTPATATAAAASASAAGNSRYAPSAAAAAQQRTAVYNAGPSPDSPLIARPASQQSHYAPSNETSAYAPSGNYAPSGGYTPLQASNEGLRSSPMPDSYVPSIPEEPQNEYNAGYGSAAPSFQDLGSNPYAPSPPLSVHGDEGVSKANGNAHPGYPPRSTSYAAPGPGADESPSFYAPPAAETGGYQPYEPSGGYGEPPAAADDLAGNESSGYAPPSSGYTPYEPPSGGYVPYEAEADSPEEPKPRKPMFGDDDDDGGDRALRAAEKTRKDREADEAFRRAAEEDAKRDEEAKAKRASGGWFGGIWGKKEANAPTVYKAKLGEENAFVYDPETKRWVNKKAGAAQTPAAAPTPPPPKMGPPMSNTPPPAAGAAAGPPRPPSGAAPPQFGGMPPQFGGGPPSRAATPASSTDAPPSLQHIAGGGGGGAGQPPPAPPSRPPTSMSNASSIDDLLGAPTGGRKGTAKKGKKGGRYVDVMAK